MVNVVAFGAQDRCRVGCSRSRNAELDLRPSHVKGSDVVPEHIAWRARVNPPYPNHLESLTLYRFTQVDRTDPRVTQEALRIVREGDAPIFHHVAPVR